MEKEDVSVVSLVLSFFPDFFSFLFFRYCFFDLFFFFVVVVVWFECFFLLFLYFGEEKILLR